MVSKIFFLNDKFSVKKILIHIPLLLLIIIITIIIIPFYFSSD